MLNCLIPFKPIYTYSLHNIPHHAKFCNWTWYFMEKVSLVFNLVIDNFIDIHYFCSNEIVWIYSVFTFNFSQYHSLCVLNCLIFRTAPIYMASIWTETISPLVKKCGMTQPQIMIWTWQSWKLKLRESPVSSCQHSGISSMTLPWTIPDSDCHYHLKAVYGSANI